MMRSRDSGGFAIIGIGCRLPAADGAGAFWRLLEQGGDAVREIPMGRWDAALYHPDPAQPGRTNSRWGGFLDAVDQFDPAFFWITPREAARMDPQQRLLLEVAWEAIEDAGLPVERLTGSRTGVYIGITTKDYFRLYDRDSINGFETSGNASAIAANRISYCFGLQGPSLAIDTTCSSSLVAVHLACRSLLTGEIDLAIVGGVNLMLIADGAICFTKLGITSPDGRCRAFDAGANGIVRGEGAGVVVLKPLARALADGDRVHAVIRGSAVNQNGVTNGLMAPSPRAQEDLLRAAYDDAGVAPALVDYVEAHGTGTLLGDAIEVRTLGAVVGSGRSHDRSCLVGSVKTNIGHLEAASGIASLIKVALALSRRRIPATLHFERPNPHIDFAALGLRVAATAGPWPSPGRLGLAGVSSFGFGGCNSHVVLEEAPMVRPARPVPSCDIAQLLPVSARSPEALRALVRAYRDTFVAGAIDVSDACYTASVRRTHHAHRMTVVGRTPAELVAQLEAFLAASPPTRNPGRRAPQQRRVALLTAGGGASAGRARPDVLAEPVVRSALARYDAAFAAEGIAGVSAMLAGGEPVCGARGAAVEFALGLALAALWRSWGVTPAAIVATGSDDLLALHLTGALGLEEAVHLVAHGRPALDRGAPGTRPMTVPMFIAGATEPCSVERTPAAPKAETTSQFAMASTLTALVASGVDVFLSLGGAAPVAAVAAIAASRPPLAVSGLAQDRLERATLLHALGRVYAAGVAIDWSGVHPVPRRCVVLPAYPWQRQRHWYEPGSTIGGAVTGDELGGGRVAGRHR